MKKILLFFILLAFSAISAYSLEPVLCSINNPGASGVTVDVQLYDYGTSTNVYPGTGNQNIGSLTANSSGIISFVIGDGDANWTAVDAANVTGNYVVNVYVGGTLYAQYRLDQLIQVQSTSGASEETANTWTAEQTFESELRMVETGGGTDYVGFQAPAAVGTSQIWTLPATDGSNGQVLSTNGSGTLAWATDQTGGGGGGGTFYLEFTSFSNSSCCNDRALNEPDQFAAAASIFENSTQPKPAYGQPYAVNLEVVSVSVYLNLQTKTLVAPINFNVTPYIVNITSGTTDRALTASIDLSTLAEDTWHNIALSSATPADNLVDASTGQYVMWELNSTVGTGGVIDGQIIFRVEVKYP